MFQTDSTKPTIRWSNVRSSNLYSSHVEVAKAFAVLPTDASISAISDLGAAGGLMIMSRYKWFHGEDTASYEKIQNVS